MPTTPRKARVLLATGQAEIMGRDSFTIQLIYGSAGYIQPVTLGFEPLLPLQKGGTGFCSCVPAFDAPE